MIEKAVDRIVQRLIEEQLLEQGKRAFYVYALQLKCERCFTVGTILLISVILKNELQTLLFWLYFLNLRKHTGGYHANTFWQCYLETIITYLCRNNYNIPIGAGICLMSTAIILCALLMFLAKIHQPKRPKFDE